jgi:AT-rich interactive domain-containing protein 1
MEERGTPITQCPTISKNPLDLYRLYIFTKDRGGFLEVRGSKPNPLTFSLFLSVCLSASGQIRKVNHVNPVGLEACSVLSVVGMLKLAIL